MSHNKHVANNQLVPVSSSERLAFLLASMLSYLLRQFPFIDSFRGGKM